MRIVNYTLIASNVGIISEDHDLYDYRKHVIKDIKIGDYCWVGMSLVILRGVILRNHTIGAVNKSFKEGHCVVVGNPDRVIKYLDINKCINYRDEYKYYGYIPASEFNLYRTRYLI